MTLPTHFLGELAALSAACLWAIAVVVYGHIGQTLPPLRLNVAKGAIALGFIVVTLLILQDPVPTTRPWPLGLLLLSGVMGIGIGDTFLFNSLNQLGARRALLLQTIAPVFGALLAWIFLQETISLPNGIGMGLTIAGIFWVIVERTQPVDLSPVQPPHQIWQGIGYGLLSALAQAVGVVLARAALTQSEIGPLWSALLRIGAGEVILLLWLAWQPNHFQLITQPKEPLKLLGTIVLGACLGTYLGIWLQQTSIKYAQVGIAQSLGATSPLFVLPIVAWLGETITFRAIAGAVLALSGIALLLW